MRIEIDNEATWPERARARLARLDLQRLTPEDIADAVAYVDAHVRGARVVGFHATRLTRDEVEDMRRHGLRLPSRAFTSERLLRRVEAEELTIEDAAVLEASLGMRRPQRIGVFLRRENLRDRFALAPYFDTWGGATLTESVREPARRAALARIGAPAVIAVEVVPAFERASLAALLVATYLTRRGVEAVEVESTAHVDEPIPGVRVLGITTEGEDAFAALTGQRGRAA